MKTYSVGIIGFGGFGQFLMNSWQQLKNVKVVAVADENPKVNPGGEIQFYQRWQDILQDDRVDILAIATPPATHAAMACAAMEAGKHVLIEKPVALNVEQARQIIKTRDRTGKIASVDYMLRFNPLVEALGYITQHGHLGKLRHVNVENYAQDESLPPEHWFWNPQISGGILIEHAVHFIDLVHAITEQKCVSVTGFSHKRNDKQEDQVLACALYDAGLIATHYHSFARSGFFEDTSLRLNYDLGQVDLHGWIPLSGNITAVVNSRTKQALTRLPSLQIAHASDVKTVKDVSRPQGWGRADGPERDKSRIRSAGIEYDVHEMIAGGFSIKKNKQQVYADSLCALFSDLINKIENPHHRMRVELEDALTSLEIAQLATEFAHGLTTRPSS